MATLSPSSSLHRDIRSEARGYKRDKDSSSKWAIGTRPSPGVKTHLFSVEPLTGSIEQQARVRPEKKNSDQTSYSKYHSNTMRYGSTGHASSRIARKADARAESASSSTLSRSLAELAPQNSPFKTARTPSIEAGVLYSFDAKSSPNKGVGLDSLVEKAEREWTNKETAKLVQNEYEILDESGEITVVKQSKKGKLSPKSRPQLVTADDEDDWERI